MRRLRLNWALPRRVVGVSYNRSGRVKRASAFYAIFILLSALLMACGGDPGETDTGEGGNGSSSSSGTAAGGSTSSSSSSSSSSGGGGDVCHPKISNNWCEGASSCECLPTPTTEESWCATWPGICPPDGDTCTPGHNQCGYDLPKGEDYVVPNNCADYVDGDTWRDATGEFTDQFWTTTYTTDQTTVVMGSLYAPNEGYYNGFVFSGNRMKWNIENRDNFWFGTADFSLDCTEVTIREYEPGASDQDPLWITTLYWVMH